MKRLLMLSVAFSTLVAVQGNAADLPIKSARAPAPVMSYDQWNGFYVGGNVGYGIGRLDTSSANAVVLGANAGTTSTTADQRSLSGVIGGGQLGWNWQTSPNWLWGLEADFQGSDQKLSASSVSQAIAGGIVQTTTESLQTKLDWFGTARLRTGYIVGNSLWYATGGLAYGRVESTSSIARGPSVPTLVGAGSVSSTKTGWTAGGGVETKLAGNWSAKLEYLYMDLGSQANNYTVFTGTGAVASNFTSSSSLHDHIVRVGANYKIW